MKTAPTPSVPNLTAAEALSFGKEIMARQVLAILDEKRTPEEKIRDVRALVTQFICNPRKETPQTR